MPHQYHGGSRQYQSVVSNQVAMGMFGSWRPDIQGSGREGSNQYAVSYLPYHDANSTALYEGERDHVQRPGMGSTCQVATPTQYTDFSSSKEDKPDRGHPVEGAYEGAHTWVNCTGRSISNLTWGSKR